MEAYDIGRNDPPNQVTANYCTDDAEPLLLPGKYIKIFCCKKSVIAMIVEFHRKSVFSL